ncbi:hypothetical protein EGR_01080 [Echinococcus granulosus]|uniref:Uncharacterized protein n=1 Tax=Echinococcus granulosus TaxID=6210 RepID=W6UZL5_ECHGR|nr:hypothetical protein EGR_01080 [Echinococcus granulosus]EUB63952.1 hypothetical protein EGR_01080 [Echinococcus granulosus]
MESTVFIIFSGFSILKRKHNFNPLPCLEFILSDNLKRQKWFKCTYSLGCKITIKNSKSSWKGTYRTLLKKIHDWLAFLLGWYFEGTVVPLSCPMPESRVAELPTPYDWPRDVNYYYSLWSLASFLGVLSFNYFVGPRVFERMSPAYRRLTPLQRLEWNCRHRFLFGLFELTFVLFFQSLPVQNFFLRLFQWFILVIIEVLNHFSLEHCLEALPKVSRQTVSAVCGLCIELGLYYIWLALGFLAVSHHTMNQKHSSSTFNLKTVVKFYAALLFINLVVPVKRFLKPSRLLSYYLNSLS